MIARHSYPMGRICAGHELSLEVVVSDHDGKPARVVTAFYACNGCEWEKDCSAVEANAIYQFHKAGARDHGLRL
ncbi:MAG: hypothetical protein NVS9B10_22280 [Nevskia sp.]